MVADTQTDAARPPTRPRRDSGVVLDDVPDGGPPALASSTESGTTTAAVTKTSRKPLTKPSLGNSPAGVKKPKGPKSPESPESPKDVKHKSKGPNAPSKGRNDAIQEGGAALTPDGTLLEKKKKKRKKHLASIRGLRKNVPMPSGTPMRANRRGGPRNGSASTVGSLASSSQPQRSRKSSESGKPAPSNSKPGTARGQVPPTAKHESPGRNNDSQAPLGDAATSRGSTPPTVSTAPTLSNGNGAREKVSKAPKTSGGGSLLNMLSGGKNPKKNAIAGSRSLSFFPRFGRGKKSAPRPPLPVAVASKPPNNNPPSSRPSRPLSATRDGGVRRASSSPASPTGPTPRSGTIPPVKPRSLLLSSLRRILPSSPTRANPALGPASKAFQVPKVGNLPIEPRASSTAGDNGPGGAALAPRRVPGRAPGSRGGGIFGKLFGGGKSPRSAKLTSEKPLNHDSESGLTPKKPSLFSRLFSSRRGKNHGGDGGISSRGDDGFGGKRRRCGRCCASFGGGGAMARGEEEYMSSPRAGWYALMAGMVTVCVALGVTGFVQGGAWVSPIGFQVLFWSTVLLGAVAAMWLFMHVKGANANKGLAAVSMVLGVFVFIESLYPGIWMATVVVSYLPAMTAALALLPPLCLVFLWLVFSIFKAL